MMEDKVIYPYEMSTTDFVMLFQEARNQGKSPKQVLDEAFGTYLQRQRSQAGGSEE